jgi:hypothetical protein
MPEDGVTSDHLITRSTDVPISTALTPLDVWIAIKVVLRRELGEREWEMWIQHARLWRVMSGDTLGVLMPRNGRSIYGVNRHIKRVRRLASKMKFGVIISPFHDMEQFQLRGESIDALPDHDPRKRKLLEKWETQQAWLAFPFLEPPCSPLWEGFNG